MNTAKIFMSGRSQAVRLPKEYRFDEEEVYINKVGNVVMLYPKTERWTSFFSGLDGLSDDCLREAPEELPFEERDEI